MTCRYLDYPNHVCTTKFGEPIHGGKVCQYEARAQLKDLEYRGVNARQLTVTGTTSHGDPVTVIIQVPRNFNWDEVGP